MRTRLALLVVLATIAAPPEGPGAERAITLSRYGKLGGNPRDLSFPTPTIGYVVGDDFSYPLNNFIARTTDGGWTWVDITPSALTERPWSVKFINADTGFVGAFNGLLLRTSDRGASWANVNTSGYTGSIYDIQFPTPDTGWASGTSAAGSILRTVNGGLTWTLINPGIAGTRYSILAYNGREAVFSGNSGSVIRTTDGGTTFGSGTAGTNTIYTLQAGRGDTVFAAGSRQLIFRSTNRGSTFAQLYDLGESQFYAMAFAPDSSSAIVVGSNGINYSTQNGWAGIDSLPPTSFIGDVCRAVAWLSPNDLVVGADHGTLLRSSDGGSSWRIVESSTPFYAIDFFDAQNGVAVGWRGAIIRTTDGGTTWTHMKGMQGPAELYDVQMTGPASFYTCGSFNTVRLTTDGGATFTDRSLPGSPPGTTKALRFLNPTMGYATGTNGIFYYTQNGGVNWTPVFSFPTPNNDMEDIFFANDTVGFVSGKAGRSARTTDRVTWDSLTVKVPVPPYPSGEEGTVWDLAFLSGQTGYAGCNHGAIFKTTNAGASWTLQSDTIGLTMVDVYGLLVDRTDSIGFAIGDEGKVFRRAASSSWVIDTTLNTVRGQPDRLYGIDAVYRGRGFACGYYGTIYRLDYTLPPEQIQVSVPYVTGWNLLSNPVITPYDSVLQLFPMSALNYAFTFGPSGYFQSRVMEYGKGYWVKTAGSGTASISGDIIQNGAIPVSSGWNIIAGMSLPVDTSDISSIPPGIICSPFYGFDHGYAAADTLSPGKGYWVKACGSGVLVFPPPATGRKTGARSR